MNHSVFVERRQEKKESVIKVLYVFFMTTQNISIDMLTKKEYIGEKKQHQNLSRDTLTLICSSLPIPYGL